ncbi:IS3 family transposase [Dietzia sp. DQ12-76]|nr:IS3 family transposase [Dietzia sp. DQ12-76]
MYGVPKMCKEMGRVGHQVARCTVDGLMRAEGLKGIQRAKSPHSTRPKPRTARRVDVMERKFVAERPNRLWVADITYIRTYSGWRTRHSSPMSIHA